MCASVPFASASLNPGTLSEGFLAVTTLFTALASTFGFCGMRSARCVSVTFAKFSARPEWRAAWVTMAARAVTEATW